MRLFRTRRFWPLFLTQFLGALNDNLLKNAMVMLVTYRMVTHAGHNAQMLVTLAAGVFILPYFLFSALAGQLADKYDRAMLTQVIKTIEIIIMAIAAFGLLLPNIGLLFIVLFAMGVHSTCFGPIKYALLPQHLHADELVSGNGYIEAGTFLAILLGTILGSVLVLQAHGAEVVAALLLLVAVLGYGSCRQIPHAPAPVPGLRLGWNLWRETSGIIAYSRGDRRIFTSILGISWFWLVGATLLAEFAPFVRDVLHAGPLVVTLLLTLFSVGIGGGALLCNLLLRGRMTTRYVPLACLGIALFGIDLYFASRHVQASGQSLMSLWVFVVSAAGLRVSFDLLLMAMCGGLYIVPLYVTMQHCTPPAHMARVIAANNVMNALFMVASALLTLLLLTLKLSIPEIFLTVAVATLGVAFYLRWQQPQRRGGLPVAKK